MAHYVSTRKGRRAAYLLWRIIGDGPHVCLYEKCKHPDVPVTRGGRTSSSGVIHHADGDKFNDDVSNLVPMHMGCHNAYHIEVSPPRNPDGWKYLPLNERRAAALRGWETRRG